VQRANPQKEVIITEFGWPNGPVGKTEKNKNTEQHCGIAAKDTQFLVVQSTFKKLAEKNISGVLFEAFSENWKPSNEGNFGNYWGWCEGKPPYSCPRHLDLQ
jgi:exo-beta-1,3-glucanase (GH17 family)